MKNNFKSLFVFFLGIGIASAADKEIESYQALISPADLVDSQNKNISLGEYALLQDRIHFYTEEDKDKYDGGGKHFFKSEKNRAKLIEIIQYSVKKGTIMKEDLQTLTDGDKIVHVIMYEEEKSGKHYATLGIAEAS